MDGRTDGQTDRLIDDRQTDRQAGRQIDGKEEKGTNTKFAPLTQLAPSRFVF
jgi:hypothetical protein